MFNSILTGVFLGCIITFILIGSMGITLVPQDDITCLEYGMVDKGYSVSKECIEFNFKMK